MDIEELKVRASSVLQALAVLTGAKGYVWILLDKDKETHGACSASLKDFERPLKEVVKSAAGLSFEVVDNTPRRLRDAKCLKDLVDTKHVELHPMVAALIKGLNQINGHKIPRSRAIAEPETVPHWFPRFLDFAKKYAGRVQDLGLDELFPVMDAVFDHVRTWDLAKVRRLRAMLRGSYRPLVHSVGNWAGLECYFDALEAEVMHPGGIPGGPDELGGPASDAAAELELSPHGNARGLAGVNGEHGANGGGDAPPLPTPGSGKPRKKRARKERPGLLQVPPVGEVDVARGAQKELRTPSPQAYGESRAQPSGSERNGTEKDGTERKGTESIGTGRNETELPSGGKPSPEAEISSRGIGDLGVGGQLTEPGYLPGAEPAPSLDGIWGQGTAAMFVDRGDGSQPEPREAPSRTEYEDSELERTVSLSVMLNPPPLLGLEEVLSVPAVDDLNGFGLGNQLRAFSFGDRQLFQGGEELRFVRLDQVENQPRAAFETANYDPSAGTWHVDEQTRILNGHWRVDRNELLDAAAPFMRSREAAPAGQRALPPTAAQVLRGIVASGRAVPVPVGAGASAGTDPVEATTLSPTFQRTNARNARQAVGPLAPPVELRSRQPGRRAAPSLSPAASLVNRGPGTPPPKRGILVPAGFGITKLLLGGVKFLSPKRGPSTDAAVKDERGVESAPEPDTPPNHPHSALAGYTLSPSKERSPRSGQRRRRASTGTGTIPSSEGWQETSEPFPVPRSPTSGVSPGSAERKEGAIGLVLSHTRGHTEPAGSELLRPEPLHRGPVSGPPFHRASTKVRPLHVSGADDTSGEEDTEPFPVPRSPIPSVRVKPKPPVAGAETEPEARESRPGSVNVLTAGGGPHVRSVNPAMQAGSVPGRPSPSLSPGARNHTSSVPGPHHGVKAGNQTASEGAPVSLPAGPIISSVQLASKLSRTAELAPARSLDGAPVSVLAGPVISSVSLASRASKPAEPARARSLDGTNAARDRPETVADRTDAHMDGLDAARKRPELALKDSAEKPAGTDARADGTDAGANGADAGANGADDGANGKDAGSDSSDGGVDDTDADADGISGGADADADGISDGTDATAGSGEECSGDESDTADGADVTEGFDTDTEGIEASDDADSPAAAHAATGRRAAPASESDAAAKTGTFPRASYVPSARERSEAAKRDPRVEHAAGRDKAPVAMPGRRANGFVPGVSQAAPPVVALGGTLEARIAEKELRAVQLDAVVAGLEERMATLWTSARALSAELDGWGTPTSVLEGHPTAESRRAVPETTRSPLSRK